jgi:hypothetical protein
LADVTPCQRRGIVIMGQLQLKYHPMLTAKEIFAANKVKLPNADKAFIIILTNRCNILAKGLSPLF